MPERAFKRCTKCGEEKLLEEFHSRPDRASKKSRCKACQVEYLREWRARNPDKMRSYREAQIADGRLYRQNRAYKFKSQYGITVEEFDQMLIDQKGQCALCSADISAGGEGRGKGMRTGNAAVDHDHVTGKVRGLLCITCNLMLGYAKDDPALLGAAIDYLKEHVE